MDVVVYLFKMDTIGIISINIDLISLALIIIDMFLWLRLIIWREIYLENHIATNVERTDVFLGIIIY